MILEPILNAVLMKVVLNVTGQYDYTLLRFKLAETDAALVLIREALGAPLNLEHFVEHLLRLPLLSSVVLRPLKPFIEEVGDEARE